MEKRRSLPGAPREKRAREGRAGSHPLAHSVARTEPVGDCRVAINAVELTPGCPFAGKVRLKERRNRRQLPRSASERASVEWKAGGREGELCREGRGLGAKHVYNASSAVAFILLLALPSAWRRGPSRRDRGR